MDGQQSDEDLMLAYGKGDFLAFEVIYKRYRGALYRYLLRQCGSTDDAQELFQDVWTNLIRARERYEVRARFTTYLFRLAHNRVIDYYRRQSHNPAGAVSQPNTEGEEDSLEVQNLPDLDSGQVENRLHLKRLTVRLLELIQELPQPQREAFLLREEAGFSVDEIAEITGVNPETAKSRLRYAVAKLRQGLQGFSE